VNQIPRKDSWRDQSKINQPKGWHSRGYLPHFDGGQITQFITYRLYDSLPAAFLRSLDHELSHLGESERALERRRRIQNTLDRGHGNVWLKNPCIARMVEESLLYFDGERYSIHSWVVMPNHVHGLITPKEQISLSDILHSWKSYTAKEANRILGRKGRFWQDEYFDRYIRSAGHFKEMVKYIEENPVKAGLCRKAEDWPFGSARRRKEKAK